MGIFTDDFDCWSNSGKRISLYKNSTKVKEYKSLEECRKDLGITQACLWRHLNGRISHFKNLYLRKFSVKYAK